jgi:glycosyltransferase involved in cell wall biosynthesis
MMSQAHTGRRLKVTVVTPSFNQGPFIERTLRSVLCQSYPHIEYIVVDGGSTDQTREILARHAPYLDRLIVEKDDGQADALNKGFAAASGDILAYLNSDDCYADPEAIARVVSRFEQDTEIDVLYGPRWYLNAAGYGVDWFPPRAFVGDDLSQCDFIPQECAFWRRAIFERAGSFIDRSYDFAMDYELWLRLLAHGARFVAMNEYIALFRTHGSQKTSAEWSSKGLAEVHRLQMRYLGQTLSEAEMAGNLRRHLFGAPVSEQSIRAAGHWMAVKFAALRRRLGLSRPMDQWVYEAPIPARHSSPGPNLPKALAR